MSASEQKLWIISIPGPDDIYAAPSYEVALLMKAHHYKYMTELVASMRVNGETLRICAEDMLAIIEECDDAEEHAELLKEFSYANWGITDEDLINLKDQTQPTLFDQDGKAT